MTALAPTTAAELRDIVADAVARTQPLEIVGRGTKRGLGRPVVDAVEVSAASLTAATVYEPEELVLTASPALRLAELEAMLAQSRQQFAFEPPDLGPLLGAAADAGTLGGALLCNLAGPRRLSAGAARDHILGFKAVNGHGDAFKSGGRVVKNVTGYDLSKLMTGSYGTLAVLTEVSVKVLPQPEKTRTVLVRGLDDTKAIQALTAALHGLHEPTAAAHLPAAVAARSSVGYVAKAGGAVTAIRLEGFAPSVEARCAALKAELGALGEVEELHSMNSVRLWKALRDAEPLVGRPELVVWRVSVAPAAAPAVVAAIGPMALHWYDWGGGLIWLGLAQGEPDAGAARVRAAVAPAGGHATLIRADAALRRAVAVFEPQAPALAALTARVKHSFDPQRILNRGRMYEAH
ncbi:MAG: FAD-binding protein [Proteobacteria bacterium]|nr:FAD-binding protein [Pseudomonadota bacterium]